MKTKREKKRKEVKRVRKSEDLFEEERRLRWERCVVIRLL